jgi:hypothetical protein
MENNNIEINTDDIYSNETDLLIIDDVLTLKQVHDRYGHIMPNFEYDEKDKDIICYKVRYSLSNMPIRHKVISKDMLLAHYTKIDETNNKQALVLAQRIFSFGK